MIGTSHGFMIILFWGRLLVLGYIREEGRTKKRTPMVGVLGRLDLPFNSSLAGLALG
jgi:hypothetical protein